MATPPSPSSGATLSKASCSRSSNLRVRVNIYGNMSGISYGNAKIRIARATRLLAKEDAGATMVEYGIMVMLIASLVVAIVRVVGIITASYFAVGNSL